MTTITTAGTATVPGSLCLSAPCSAAMTSATELLAYLAPLFPNVAGAARTEAGAAAWVASWAAQIEAESVSPQRLAGALTLLGELDPDLPLSWPRFAELVRRHRFIKPNLKEEEDRREKRLAAFKAKYPGARL